MTSHENGSMHRAGVDQAANGDRDPELAAWFANAPAVAEDAAFTSVVIRRTRRVKGLALLGAVLALLLLLGVLWAFSVPLGDWALLTVQLVATPLVAIPDGWWNWILAPINTLGTALVVLWRVVRLLSRKAIGASYVN